MSAHAPVPGSAWSRHLTQLFSAQPALAALAKERLTQPLDADELRLDLVADGLDEDTLKPALRQFKQRAFVRIASRDLAGLACLGEVTEAMTLVAEQAIATALAVHQRALGARFGLPRNAAGQVQQLIVVGMGKLGGRELNVSSDIDLIFVYPDDGQTDGGTAAPTRSISNFDFFTRLGRALINAIADITEGGQVFRVDMRLRPNGDSGPLVCSFDMLENYFIAQGREWERYAWIKARALSGERHDELEAIRRPFVFRKYLDFGAINAMRELHVQIRREVARKDMAGNIKLGPGGIREIEFIAQVFQLIRGGRDTALQCRPTLAVLGCLAAKGMLDDKTVKSLSAAYDFLRRLEHRLQYVDDAQTHSLPEATGECERIAAAMGFACWAALLDELDDHRGNVMRQFEAVFAEPRAGEHPLAALWHGAQTEHHLDTWQELGFFDPAAAAARLAALHAGARYAQMSSAIRARFDALVPQVIAAAATRDNRDVTLLRALDMLEAISRRAAYLALLQQYPQALAKLMQLLGSSRWAAGYLQRHPILLDELLDARLLDARPDWAQFREQLQERLDASEPDTERQMDLMREMHHAQVFRLLVQDIAGQLSVEVLADHLSQLADILLDAAIARVWCKLATRHLATPRFAIISYGKLGGKELGYASDLDLVFLFDDDSPDCAQTYSRLGTRLNTWLSAQTSAGQLFDTDLRLRPNGESGLVVSSIDAFAQYQRESAWVWEHQALTRARFSAGDAAVGAAFERIRADILRTPRDLPALRAEVLAMRRKMRDAHATRGDAQARVFDLKHDAGGLVDVEFIVQYLVLGHAHAHARLTGNLGNIALLGLCAELGLIPPALAMAAQDAYRDYRRAQHRLRLNGEKSRVDADEMAAQAAAVQRLWQHVFYPDQPC